MVLDYKTYSIRQRHIKDTAMFLQTMSLQAPAVFMLQYWDQWVFYQPNLNPLLFPYEVSIMSHPQSRLINLAKFESCWLPVQWLSPLTCQLFTSIYKQIYILYKYWQLCIPMKYHPASLWHSQVSANYSQQTPHRSPVRVSYEVDFVSLKFCHCDVCNSCHYAWLEL